MISNRTLACLFATISLCHLVSSAAVSLPSDDLAKSIEEVQKKFTGTKIAADKRQTIAPELENKVDDLQPAATETKPEGGGDDMMTEESIRNNKMLDYFGYYAAYPSSYPGTYPAGYPAMYASPYPPYMGDEYDDEYNGNAIDDEDDAFSRANSRRKPGGVPGGGGAGQNSPIFYIRLPPTPYMYVPGMGYISQPPTMQPIAPQFSLPPPPQPAMPQMSPFINLPINYVSNAKPSGIYQWNSQSNFGPQFPSYLPPRPRPTYNRPKPYIQPQNSKITHLKGPYVFNGRPEDVYLLPNPHFANPYNSPYHHNPYAAPPPPPYSGYTPVYNPLQSYY